jgi:hypothetical protein
MAIFATFICASKSLGTKAGLRLVKKLTSKVLFNDRFLSNKEQTKNKQKSNKQHHPPNKLQQQFASSTWQAPRMG